MAMITVTVMVREVVVAMEVAVVEAAQALQHATQVQIIAVILVVVKVGTM